MKWGFIAGALAVTALLGAGGTGAGERWWSHVQYLASDKLEGRGTGTPGHRKAASYVAAQFEKAGLQPGGTDGYLQPVPLKMRRIVEKGSSVALVREGAAEPLQLGEDGFISSRVDPAANVEAPVVFAGYGLTIPEANYDDFAGLDVRGKLVAYLIGGPPNVNGPLSAHYQSQAERARILKQAGAIGLVTLINPATVDLPWSRIALSRSQGSMVLADRDLDETSGLRLGIVINPERTEKLFAGSGHTFAEILSLAKAGKSLPRFPLKVALRAKAEVERSELESHNVIGILPGSDPLLKQQYVTLSAHLDHLGIGAPIDGDRIYNGAMDNASGVASLLDIAQRLRDSGAKLKRSLLFIAVTGEEKGELGSFYFAMHPTVGAGKIAADLNMDMFLPLFPMRSVVVLGLKESDLGERARAAAREVGIEIGEDREPQRNLFIRSDQYSFIRKGIPALAFKIGYEPGSPEEKKVQQWLRQRYHAPSDDLGQPVDLQAADRFNQFLLAVAEEVANHPARPRWNESSFFRRFAN